MYNFAGTEIGRKAFRMTEDSIKAKISLLRSGRYGMGMREWNLRTLGHSFGSGMWDDRRFLTQGTLSII